jgi:membrane protein implicated in regulation of membrane protease activity
MKKAYLFWVADYAAGIAAALALGLLLLLIVGWVNVFGSHWVLGLACTVLGAVIIALLVRGVPYVRQRADERRLAEPDESLSSLLRELKQARTEREERVKMRGGRRYR